MLTLNCLRLQEERAIRKYRYALVAILIVVCDQISKYAVRVSMNPGDRISVIGNWFTLYYVQNTGTAFSMFSGNKWVTVVLTSILLIACIIFVISELRKNTKASNNLAMIVTLIIAGGIGNMIDRLAFGFVTDMLSFGSFAIFNVADIFVTCGCIGAMLYILYTMKTGEEI